MVILLRFYEDSALHDGIHFDQVSLITQDQDSALHDDDEDNEKNDDEDWAPEGNVDEEDSGLQDAPSLITQGERMRKDLIEAAKARQERGRKQWELVLEQLVKYKEKHGDCLVPDQETE